MRKCFRCHSEIAEARLRALPSTQTCVSCSREAPLKGSMTWEHKTAPALEVQTQEQFEAFRRHSRKGVHASLPLARRTSEGAPSIAPQEPVQGVRVNAPRARCHPDRPAVSYGRCFECSVEWYNNRAKLRAASQKEKP
jgi:hypothetical protein